MKIIIIFPEWVVEGSKDNPSDYFQFRRKYIRQVIRFSPRVKHSLCKIIDAIDALRREKQDI